MRAGKKSQSQLRRIIAGREKKGEGKGEFAGHNSQRRRELAQGFIEVICLREDANDEHDSENVGRWVRKLILAVRRKGELQSEPKGLYGHDGDGAHDGADGYVHQWIAFAVAGRNSVYHDDQEDRDDGTVCQEA
jgi:hypothetical protein